MNQQLKKELKVKVKAIKAKGCPGYINLSIASIEQLQAYILQWKDYNPESETEEESKPEEVIPADFTAINNAKTLSELGKAIANLAGTGEWNDWEMRLWTKNGECRIYMKDCSYTNPKDRGYYLINENGTVQVLSQPNCRFPNLPTLPTVENDLTSSHKLSPEQRAINKLNSQFGIDGWDQRDLDDELERDEHQ